MSDSFLSKVVEFEGFWYKQYNFRNEAELFLAELNKAEKETDIQRYIKNNQKWFIPASIFEDFDFGHHEAYLVPEQAIGTEYRADYMLVGRNSIGHHIVLVEFEGVNVDYCKKTSNEETEAVRKGITQLRDWQRWMQFHRDYFMESSELLSKIKTNVPPWGIWYYLVVSRRERMNDISNQLRGEKARETPGVKIVSYDRLVDNVKKLSNGF